jgi:DNA-binding beta-propeller fold protein YncE
MSRTAFRFRVTTFVLLALSAADASAQAPTAAPAPKPPTNDYWVYVGAESADRIYRVRFGPSGGAVERSVVVGESAVEMEGPHGLQISRDGKFLHMTTGHGSPDGKYWKFELGPDTLVGPGIFLGYFPASLDLTPDGMYAFVVNFNLHGEMVPSSVSVVYTPTNTEVARITTCTMPHGSRVDRSGSWQYSTCMMDDQLVEIDTRSFEVSRRFSVAKGKEGALPATFVSEHAQHAASGHRMPMPPASCSPTWAQPSADGKKVYVACNKADEILELDHASWTVTRRFPTGRGPYNLAVTPDGRLLLASLKQGGAFQVFDLASGSSVLQTKSSTTVTHGIAVSPDSKYAFVSNESVGAKPGRVDVYDLAALVRVAAVDVGQQAGGIAFWKMAPAGPSASSDAALEGLFRWIAVDGRAAPADFPPGSGALLTAGSLDLRDVGAARSAQGGRFGLRFTTQSPTDTARATAQSGRFRIVGDSLHFSPTGREDRPPVMFRYSWRPDSTLVLTDAQGHVWTYIRR